jgi:putative protein kinase ArgK-like GTPase of G3E family
MFDFVLLSLVGNIAYHYTLAGNKGIFDLSIRRRLAQNEQDPASILIAAIAFDPTSQFMASPLLGDYVRLWNL